MNASYVMYIALGGALGAVGRYVAMSAVGAFFGHGFPYGTLTVNIVGSFILGAFVEVAALSWSPGPELRAMVVVGVLGAFTTFSAFSLDAVVLMTRGETAAALGYIAVSVVGSIASLWAGMTLFRAILA